MSQLTSTKISTHFDPSQKLVLSCDASPYGVGTVLSHQFPDDTRDQLHMPPALWQLQKKSMLK